MLRKLCPCQIVKNFGTNAYEIQLPPKIGISLIFNISELTPFKVANEEVDIGQFVYVEDIKYLPLKEAPKLEKVLDTKIVKKTRGKEYKQYLIKIRGYFDVDAMWMTKEDIKKKSNSTRAQLKWA